MVVEVVAAPTVPRLPPVTGFVEAVEVRGRYTLSELITPMITFSMEGCCCWVVAVVGLDVPAPLSRVVAPPLGLDMDAEADGRRLMPEGGLAAAKDIEVTGTAPQFIDALLLALLLLLLLIVVAMLGIWTTDLTPSNNLL